MSYRPGEITRQQIDRDWPHQVEVPAHITAGAAYRSIHEFAESLSVAPRKGRSSYRDGVDYVRFAFSRTGDADAFQERYGGIRVTAIKRGGRWEYEPLKKADALPRSPHPR